MVLVSNDEGATWVTAAASNGILVVVPGAGTYQNAAAFNALKSSYDVTLAHPISRAGGFKYPPGWGDMSTVAVSTDPDDSLMGVARSIGAHIKAGGVPQLIIVGSRGGQVVLPVLLRSFWRGPFVAINAGPLTSNSAIPVGSDPWFVTCGHDYFETKNNDVVERKFERLSEVDGHNVRLTDEPHMPNLNEAGQHLLPRLCDHILSQSTHPMVPLTDAPYTMHALSCNARARVDRTTLQMTVLNTQHQNTLLRRDPKGDSLWIPGVAVPNNLRVSVLGQSHDTQGHEMLLVQAGNVNGWIYARNLRELQ
jgi:hypothetical protein